MASNWDTNTYDWTKSAGSVFGNSAPSFNVGNFATGASSPWSGSAWSAGSSPTFTPDWGGTLNLPGLSGSGALRTPGILRGSDWSGSVPSYARDSDFNVGKAFEAVGKSLSRLGGSRGFMDSSVDRSIKGSVANAELVGKGRGYRMYQSGPDIYEKKEVEQRAPGRGIGSTLLGIAAPIASVIPGGQVVGAGLAAGSGALGAFGL